MHQDPTDTPQVACTHHLRTGPYVNPETGHRCTVWGSPVFTEALREQGEAGWPIPCIRDGHVLRQKVAALHNFATTLVCVPDRWRTNVLTVPKSRHLQSLSEGRERLQAAHLRLSIRLWPRHLCVHPNAGASTLWRPDAARFRTVSSGDRRVSRSQHQHCPLPVGKRGLINRQSNQLTFNQKALACP